MHLFSFLQLAGGIAFVLAEPVPRHQHAPIKPRCLNETDPPYPIPTGYESLKHRPSGFPFPTGIFPSGVFPSGVFPSGVFPTGTGLPFPSDPYSYPTPFPKSYPILTTAPIATGTGTAGPLSYFSTGTPLYPNSTVATLTILATGSSYIILSTGTSYSTSSALDPNATTSGAPYPVPSNSTIAGTGTGTSGPTAASISASYPTAGPTGSSSTSTSSVGTVSSILATTTFSSTNGPFSFTTVTKSVPSEYFYHHHHKGHHGHKDKDPFKDDPFGYGPFRGGFGDDG